MHRQSGAPFFTKFIWPEAINPEILEEAPGTIVLKRSRECRVVKKDPKLLWGRVGGLVDVSKNPEFSIMNYNLDPWVVAWEEPWVL